MVKAFSSKDLKEHGRFDEDMPDWMDDLVKISFKETRSLTLRPLTPMIMMARHWPVSLTSGKNCPPIWCPKFNSETQKFDLDYPCHLHDDFGDRWKAQKVIIFGALVREWQEDGKKNPVGLIVLPGSTSVALVQIVGINKYDVSDPLKGCDINVVNAKEAPPANQWQIQRTERTPLTEAEKAYKVPNLDKVSPDFGDPKFLAMFTKEMKRKLANFAYYVEPLDNGEEGWKGYKKNVEGQPYVSFPDLAALVGDGKTKDGAKGSGSSDPKKKSRDEGSSGGKLTRKHEVVEDDDEDVRPVKSKKAPPPDDDDEESDAEIDEDEKPVKSKKAPPPDEDDDDVPPPKKAKAKPPADEDDEEQADGEDDDVPPPKKAKKAPPPDEDDDVPPPKKTKAKVDKDEEAEAPFDPDEEEEEEPKPKAKPTKLKVIQPLDGAEDWSEEYSISWKKNEEDESVPKCFGVFAGAKKCKACPVRKACTAADQDG